MTLGERPEERASRDPTEIARRRLKAARLLDRGMSQAETARLVGVSRQSVHRWVVSQAQFGVEWLRRAPRLGRKPRLDEPRQRELIRELKRGPRAQGFDAADWTIALVKRFIQGRYGVSYRKTPLVSQLLGQAGFEPAGRRGWRVRVPKSVARDVSTNAAWRPSATAARGDD